MNCLLQSQVGKTPPPTDCSNRTVYLLQNRTFLFVANRKMCQSGRFWVVFRELMSPFLGRMRFSEGTAGVRGVNTCLHAHCLDKNILSQEKYVNRADFGLCSGAYAAIFGLDEKVGRHRESGHIGRHRYFFCS